MVISTAVGLERVSRVVGYQVKAANFQEVTPNLPQSIVIFAEANTDNQAGLDVTKREITSAKEASEIYGNGSPAHSIMRILRPTNGGIVGGIPTYIIAQPEVGGAVASERTITVTGTPTTNGTHYMSINGRTAIDGASYGFTVITTDTPTTIAVKMKDAVNSALSSPFTATSAAGVVTLVSKWKGLTAEQCNAEVFTLGEDLGMSYVVATTVAGSGNQTIATDLAKIGSAWDTVVVNSYDGTTFVELEDYNGTPDAVTPSGRYGAIVFKPMIALWGSIDSDKDSIVAITNLAARKDQVTNVMCPAPNSKGFTWEASANGASLVARTFQDTPHLSVNALAYEDMPVPVDGNIGDFADYNNRDFMVKKGASTVDLVNGAYVFQDLVTTYAPDGEANPSWRYVRSLMQDFNVRYGYFLLEEVNVRDHAITSSDQVTSVTKVIKPKQWKQILNNYFTGLAERVLIVEPDFSLDSLQVGTSETNPDRIETSFRYKRSGLARIASTTAEAGFAFGVR